MKRKETEEEERKQNQRRSFEGGLLSTGQKQFVNQNRSQECR